MTQSANPVPDAAAAHLIACDPDWSGLIAAAGSCQIQLKPAREPSEALMRAIAYQQLHSRAAEAILARLLARFPGPDFPSPAALLALPVDDLRACGFSAGKAATLRGIAEGRLSGLVPDRAEADTLSDAELIERLTALRGVGRWTVEMLLMFTLARPDVLPVGDFGVREGWRLLKSLPEQPRPAELARLGEAWSPWRTTAAWYLWRAVDLSRQGWQPGLN